MRDSEARVPDSETAPAWALTCLRIRNGRQLAGVLTGAQALSFDNDAPRNDDETLLIDQLHEDIQDWDAMLEVGGHALVGAETEFTRQIDRLALRELYVYAAKKNEQGQAAVIPTAYVRVRRLDLEQIVLTEKP